MPRLIGSRLGPYALYTFNLSLFLAALTSMLPLGEIVGRITAEVLDVHREDGLLISLGMALAIGTVVSLLGWIGFDPIPLLDGAVSTFILFGGIIEAYAAVKGKRYIPGWLRAWAWFGILTALILGLYAFIGSRFSSVVFIGVVLLSLALNGRLEKRLVLKRKRFLGR